jgi:hypothetical protein
MVTFLEADNNIRSAIKGKDRLSAVRRVQIID